LTGGDSISNETFLTPPDFRKYFYASLILAVFCLVGALIAVSSSGSGNLFEETISGQGTVDHGTYSKHGSDRALAEDAEVVYQMKREWGGEDQTFLTSFTVTGARGGYKNQYVVKASGADYKHTYQATQITGNFTGSGASVVTVETGIESIDSLVLMDGNATFRGRIINGQTGKPVTESETDAVGQFFIRSYLNISKPPKTVEDWLAFCSELDDLPGGAKIVGES